MNGVNGHPATVEFNFDTEIVLTQLPLLQRVIRKHNRSEHVGMILSTVPISGQKDKQVTTCIQALNSQLHAYILNR